MTKKFHGRCNHKTTYYDNVKFIVWIAGKIKSVCAAVAHLVQFQKKREKETTQKNINDFNWFLFLKIHLFKVSKVLTCDQ